MESISGWIFITVCVYYGGFRLLKKIIEEDIARKNRNRAEWDEFGW